MKNKNSPVISIIILLAVVLVAGILISRRQPEDYNKVNQPTYMKISSTVFVNNGKIPVQYTCNGAGTQPPLQVSDVPKDAKSLALLVDDPDAPNGDFVHWVVWGIGPNISTIENGNIPGAMEGYTGLGKPGWVAPCPPSGIHHYNFKLYALDTVLSMPASSAKTDLVSAMTGHVIDSATLVGLYGKEN